ncbi:hypothetical protein FB451DRAFT_1397744 [Mycena latifolia]|nr:hypothetical protein FB451DRAFT_1397744 [Mycena latifolia]
MTRADFLLAPLLFNLVQGATNDWNVPCFDGKCSYDHPDPSFPASLKIISPRRADLSVAVEAAGWIFLIPGLSSFEITFGLDADFLANLTLSASASVGQGFASSA